jgi:hypothetical protein
MRKSSAAAGKRPAAPAKGAAPAAKKAKAKEWFAIVTATGRAWIYEGKYPDTQPRGSMPGSTTTNWNSHHYQTT